jgi:hypothetical protein
MVIAMDLEENITSLMARLVCSMDNEQCMLQKRLSCPSTDKLITHLQSCLDSADWIMYKQWMHTDRTNLENSEPVSEFIDKLVKKLKDLLVHIFIANKQADFARPLKENLTVEECLINLDFDENYSFVIQDAVQSYHWTNASVLSSSDNPSTLLRSADANRGKYPDE